MKLKVKRWHPDAKLPEIAHPGEDFGYDVFACTTGMKKGNGIIPTLDGIQIAAGAQVMIPIGWAVEFVSDFAWERYGLIAKQPSGLASRRMLDVKAGVIDAGYRNEVKILLYNYGTDTQYIEHHEKIGQLVPLRVYATVVEEVNELSSSDRGLNGWGSGAKK